MKTVERGQGATVETSATTPRKGMEQSSNPGTENTNMVIIRCLYATRYVTSKESG